MRLGRYKSIDFMSSNGDCDIKKSSGDLKGSKKYIYIKYKDLIINVNWVLEKEWYANIKIMFKFVVVAPI